MKFITRTKGIRGEQLCIAGTRFPVCRILSELADGYTLDQISEDYDLDILLLRNAMTELARKFEDHDKFII